MLVTLPGSDPELTPFGRRLRAAREARSVTLAWLADRTDISKVTLGLAEQGRCRLTSADLHRVTGALRLSLDFLMEDRDLTGLKPFV